MIEIEVPEGGRVAVPLTARTTRGDGEAWRLAEAVVVGAPRHVRLSPELAADDAELRAYLAAEQPEWAYHLVAFSCTFAPEPGRDFATAWVRVDLAAEPSPPPAVAHSMEPLVEERIRQSTRAARLGFTCVLQTEVEVSETKTSRKAFLQAMYEGTATPAWTLTAGADAAIRGLQRFRFVVRSRPGAVVTGRMSVGATVKRQVLKFKTVSYVGEAAPDLDFTLTS